MVTTETKYAHIVLDEQGRPRIEGTRMRVLMLVQAMQADNLRPEELAREYPQLTLGQIYSALAYYADHQQELDAETERELASVAEMRARNRVSPALEQVRAIKYGR